MAPISKNVHLFSFFQSHFRSGRYLGPGTAIRAPGKIVGLFQRFSLISVSMNAIAASETGAILFPFR